jgi:hypothetical protein
MATAWVGGGAWAQTPVEAASQRLAETVAQDRAILLASEPAKDPQLRAEGLYLLQAMQVMGFNCYVAPRQQYPALYVQSMYMPLELSWGMTNPDFLYHHGYIDGAHTYRIWGNRRGNFWATIQVNRGFWGDDVGGVEANVDFDALPTTPDGSFEIFLGPQPPQHAEGQYWVKLDPTIHNYNLDIRETFYDWVKDRPLDIHIETLDRAPDTPTFFNEDELAARIDKERKWFSAVFNFTMKSETVSIFGPDGAAKVNKFTNHAEGRQQGGNPLGYWITMAYEIAPDEALIIDTPPIKARYWGYQLGTVWGQTTDFAYHQSSLNGAQAVPDSDGHVRAVLSMKDPGVPNWLDPAGIPRGSTLLRIYKADGYVIPTVTRVKLADVRRLLPPSTPAVTPEERAATLRARQAALRWYGQ